jgi:hypothetical protein
VSPFLREGEEVCGGGGLGHHVAEGEARLGGVVDEGVDEIAVAVFELGDGGAEEVLALREGDGPEEQADAGGVGAVVLGEGSVFLLVEVLEGFPHVGGEAKGFVGRGHARLGMVKHSWFSVGRK